MTYYILYICVKYPVSNIPYHKVPISHHKYMHTAKLQLGMEAMEFVHHAPQPALTRRRSE